MADQDGLPRRSWYHSGASRRSFLAGAAALSAGALVGRLPTAAHAAEGGSGLHGVEPGDRAGAPMAATRWS
jgi:hypothetical protein